MSERLIEGDRYWYRLSTQRDPDDPRVRINREVIAEIVRISRKRVVIRLVDYPERRTRNVLAQSLYP